MNDILKTIDGSQTEKFDCQSCKELNVLADHFTNGICKKRWVANVYDPKKVDARTWHMYRSTDPFERLNEWKYYLQWVYKHEIDMPAATEKCSVDKLISMGMVGLYKRTDS
jgi:hypothetical protein